MFPKSWLRQLLETAVGLAVVAWLLNWAWGLVRPLMPVIVVGLVLAFVGSWFLRRRSRW